MNRIARVLTGIVAAYALVQVTVAAAAMPTGGTVTMLAALLACQIVITLAVTIAPTRRRAHDRKRA